MALGCVANVWFWRQLDGKRQVCHVAAMESNIFIAFAVTSIAGLATILGWLAVIRGNQANPRLLAFGLAFAAGAMIYVSLAEIFIKSQDNFNVWFGGEPGRLPYGLATLMLFIGVGLVILLDRVVPNPHGHFEQTAIKKGPNPHLARAGLLTAAAITAHNIPEGLATFFATLDDPSVGLSLALAIAIHNVPEGVSIALPIFYATGSKTQAFVWTFVSGLAELVGAILGFLIFGVDPSALTYGVVFGLIAGIMVFLSLDELLPAAKRYARSHETVYGMVIGMGLIATSFVLFR